MHDPYGPGSPPWEAFDAFEEVLDNLSDSYALDELWNWVAGCVEGKCREYDYLRAKPHENSVK